MRILYFTEKDTPHDRRFLTAAAGTDHAVYALRKHPCDPEPLAGITELDWLAGQPEWSGWAGWQDGATQLGAILEEVKPDLVHAGPVQGPAFLTALAGFQPLVTMSWGSDLLRTARRSPWMREVTQYTLARTAVFLGDCQTVVDAALAYGMRAERIVSFPWGVDLDYFSEENGGAAGRELRNALGWGDQFVVMCNRAWYPLYGVDVLAKAFAAAVKENQNLRLMLIGEGPLAKELYRVLLPVLEWVYLPGRLSKAYLPGAYCGADLFVSPSHSDGASISLLEAMACGCPILASDIPSNQEWVQPGAVGELFRDGDVGSLTQKILQMAAEPNLGLYGVKAREVAEDRADWGKNFQKLLRAYQLAVD
jgi:glycosyltransferase involved in cell wall biosynthesis